MDKSKLENINIEQHKELFEYEMTEVILMLKGEFAVVSSQVKPRSIESVDLEKLIPQPVPRMKPVKMDQKPPVVFRVPPKCTKLPMPAQCRIGAAPAELDALTAKAQINPKSNLPVCLKPVCPPVLYKAVTPPAVRSLPEVPVVRSDAVKSLSKLAADAARTGKTHFPKDIQVTPHADQPTSRLSQLAALSLRVEAAGKHAGTKPEAARIQKPKRIVVPQMKSLPKPVAAISMTEADRISPCPIKPVTIPNGKIQVNKPTDVQGLNCQNRVQQLAAMHANLLSAAQAASATNIKPRSISVELPPMPPLTALQNSIAVVTMEDAVSIPTLKASMQRMVHHTSICPIMAPVSIKPFAVDVHLPDIAGKKAAFETPKKLKTDFAAPLQAALRSVVQSSKIGQRKNSAQNK